MHKITIFFLFVLFSCSLWAQNLVLNPSFENINVTCSGFSGAGYSNVISWGNPDPTDTCSTPDWFSTCLTSLFPTSAPASWLGYQMPRTGDAYTGIILYDVTTSSYREYVEGTLSSPLVAGQTYCVSFYISLADTAPYAVSNIGVYLSNSFYQFPISHCVSTVPLPVTPQLQYTGAALTDDNNWVRLQWQYVATGGEQYFIIGNFANNSNTTVTNTGVSGFATPYAYYFIDDVSISTGICCDATIMPTGAFCTAGAAVNLQANTAGGTWSGTGITNTTAGTFDPVTAGLGTHIITYTLPCGSSDTIALLVNSCMETCVDANGNIQVSGGTGPYTWQNQTITQNCSACIIGCTFPPGCAVNVVTWANFANGASIPTPSTFPIQVTDNAGQTFVMSSLASIPACTGSACPIVLSISNNSPATCGASNGAATVNASGGTAPYNYSWSNSQTSATASNLTAGVYNCYVSDAQGCKDTLQVTVASNSTLTGSAQVVDVFCNGNKTGAITITAANGTAPYSYSWASGQTNVTITGLLAGTYTCTITDAQGCIATVSATVAQPPVLQIIPSSTNSNGTNNGTASVVISGGTPPYTYTWNTNPPQYTASITGLAPGAYTCTIVDANGCSRPATITIEEILAIRPESIGIKEMSLSPNPSTGDFDLIMELLQPDKITVGVYDLGGKYITGDTQPMALEYKHTFRLSYLSKGIYLLKVQTSKGEKVERIVVE